MSDVTKHIFLFVFQKKSKRKRKYTSAYNEDEKKMLLVGGFIGLRYETDKSLTPLFGYSIVQDEKLFDKANQD